MKITLTYDHRGRTKKGQEGPIEIRITNGEKSVFVSTGVKVMKSEFRDGEVIDRADAPELNEFLEVFRRKAVTVATKKMAEGVKLESKNIREAIFSMVEDEQEHDTDMLRWIEKQVPLLQLKPGTKKHYLSAVYRLKEYGKMTSWASLTVEGLVMWDEWLHQRRKPVGDARAKMGEDGKLINDAGVYNYHKCLKALLNRAVLFGKIDRNPYDRLKGRFKRGDNGNTEFLTKAEMDAIESIHPVTGSTMATARDLFVFQMHTGLSYADTQTFDFDDYQLIGGHWVCIGQREKNGNQYITQLSDECIRILKQYGMKLPKLDNADYNKTLKAIGLVAGIDKPLHSHLARHSFATYMLASGARIQNVSKMLGHTNIKQTQRYAKVLTESVIEDFNKIQNEKDSNDNGSRGHDHGGVLRYK